MKAFILASPVLLLITHYDAKHFSQHHRPESVMAESASLECGYLDSAWLSCHLASSPDKSTCSHHIVTPREPRCHNGEAGESTLRETAGSGHQKKQIKHCIAFGHPKSRYLGDGSFLLYFCQTGEVKSSTAPQKSSRLMQ